MSELKNRKAMLVLEYDFDLGQGFVPIADIISEVLVYDGTYEENKDAIVELRDYESVLKRVDYTTVLDFTGKKTLVCHQPFESTSCVRENIALIGVPVFDVKELGVESLSRMFYGAEKFNQDINHWDVSGVKNFMRMFEDAKSFNQPLDKWDTRSLEFADYMFANAVSFNQDISMWDVSNGRSFMYMFVLAVAFNQPIGIWNMSKAGNLSYMFYFAISFNQDINQWDVSNVRDFTGMFRGAAKFNQPLDKWNTGACKYMQMMFLGARKFNQDVSMWDINGIQSMFPEEDYKDFAINSALEASKKPNFVEVF